MSTDWRRSPARTPRQGRGGAKHGPARRSDFDFDEYRTLEPALRYSPVTVNYPAPLLAEILATPKRGTAASLFAGMGGSSTGIEWAGLDERYACEFLDQAADVYELNHPRVHVDRRSVREVQPADVLAACRLRRGELTLLNGSPPCEPFSTAGSARDSKWGSEVDYEPRLRQRQDDLFFEYVRLLDGVRPRCFVAENVASLTYGRARGYFRLIHRALAETGYRVEARIVEACRLGVAQSRPRLFFAGVRTDLSAPVAWPEPSRRETVLSDVLPHVTASRLYNKRKSSQAAWGAPFDRGAGRPAQTITSTGVTNQPTASARLVGRLGDGRAWERPWSIPELQAVSGFPEDYRWPAGFGYHARWQRLGDVVPPPVMRAIAGALVDSLERSGELA